MSGDKSTSHLPLMINKTIKNNNKTFLINRLHSKTVIHSDGRDGNHWIYCTGQIVLTPQDSLCRMMSPTEQQSTTAENTGWEVISG